MFNSWSDTPPVNLLLQSIMSAFGGGSKASAESSRVYSDEDLLRASKALAPAGQSPAEADKALREISVRAGAALPVMRGPDPGLANMKPEFDLGALRVRNHDRTADRLRQLHNIE